ncbi:MAG: hypothetical protein RL208_512 [Pseudomonadota bacterium]|jgi:hypothetical protein
MLLTELAIDKLSTTEIKKNQYWLFFGPNIGLGDYIAQKVIKNLIFDEKIVIECSTDEQSAIAELENVVYGSGLFGDVKVVKVYNITKKINTFLQDIIKENSCKNVYIFVIAGDSVDSKSSIKTLFEEGYKTVCTACYDDDETKINKLLQNFCIKNDISNLNTDEITPILMSFKHDRMLIIRELEKILLLKPEQLNTQSIKLLIESNLEELNYSTFCDNFILNNKQIAMKSFDELFKNHDVNVIQIVRILIDHIQKIKDIKYDIEVKKMQPETAIKIRGIFFQRVPFVKKQIMIKEKDLNKILDTLNNIEIKTKTLGEEIALAMMRAAIIN